MNNREAVILERPKTVLGQLDMRYKRNRVFGRNADGTIDARTLEGRQALKRLPVTDESKKRRLYKDERLLRREELRGGQDDLSQKIADSLAQEPTLTD
jgi:hypothetical protein